MKSRFDVHELVEKTRSSRQGNIINGVFNKSSLPPPHECLHVIGGGEQ